MTDFEMCSTIFLDIYYKNVAKLRTLLKHFFTTKSLCMHIKITGNTTKPVGHLHMLKVDIANLVI